MVAFVRLLTLALVAQAAADKAPLVRKSTLQNGAVPLLHQVQEMVRSGEQPAFDKVNEIKRIVNEELFATLNATHKTAVDTIKANLDSIALCNANSLERILEIQASTEVTVSTARSTHVACREEEGTKTATRDSKCGALDAFLATINDPANLPANRPRAASLAELGQPNQMVDYVTESSHYFCPKGPEVTHLDDNCTHAEEERVKQKVVCDRNQVTFESGFCTWRTELVDNCNTHSECYAAAEATYNNHVTETTELVTKWKLEWKALKKIVCYTDVWLKDSDVNTADAGTFDACNALVPDTTPMDVDYGTPDAQAACPLTSVAVYPGTPTFSAVEYHEVSAFAVPPLSCISAEATTVAPTTAPPSPQAGWIVMTGTPTNEGSATAIGHTGVSRHAAIHDKKQACEADPQCVGFAYHIADGDWFPKQVNSGFDPINAIYVQTSEWQWYYIGSRAQATTVAPTTAPPSPQALPEWKKADLANNGAWGSWQSEGRCPQNSLAIGFRQRVEGNQGSGDDTALNGVRLLCQGGHEATSHDGFWGSWSATEQCPTGQYITGYRIKNEASQGHGDDTSANGVQMKCDDGTILSPGNTQSWGSWSQWQYCDFGGKVDGVMARVEGNQGSGDDTVMGDMKIRCNYEATTSLNEYASGRAAATADSNGVVHVAEQLQVKDRIMRSQRRSLEISPSAAVVPDAPGQAHKGLVRGAKIKAAAAAAAAAAKTHKRSDLQGMEVNELVELVKSLGAEGAKAVLAKSILKLQGDM